VKRPGFCPIKAVASSADGAKQIAMCGYGDISTSTDFGNTWTTQTNYAGINWESVATSADGTKLIASGGHQLYTSTDSGTTWTARDEIRNWSSVASSSDGTKLVAADYGLFNNSYFYGGHLYTSIDSGVTWIPHESNRPWASVASSADGSRLIAAAWKEQLYTSVSSSAIGSLGAISGGQYASVDLQYVGNNKFMIRSQVGSLVVQ